MGEQKQGGEQINSEGDGAETLSEPLVPTVPPPKIEPTPMQTPPPVVFQEPTSAPAPAQLPLDEEAEEKKAIHDDKKYINEAEEIIKKYDVDPHNEEEAVEDLQIKLLSEKFNKNMKKSNEQNG